MKWPESRGVREHTGPRGVKGEGEGRGREDFRAEIANGEKRWVGVKEKRRGDAERKGNWAGERVHKNVSNR